MPPNLKAMKYLKNLFLVATLSFISISLVTGQNLIVVDESADVDFNNYKTYMWAPEVNNSASEQYIRDGSLKLAVQETIASELDDLGYTRNAGDPDFFVSYMLLKDNNQLRNVDVLEGQKLEAGTLIIQLLDREEGTILWQGSAAGILQGNALLSQTPSRNEGALNNEPRNEEYLKDGGVSANENDERSPDEKAVEAIKKIFDEFVYSADQ